MPFVAAGLGGMAGRGRRYGRREKGRGMTGDGIRAAPNGHHRSAAMGNLRTAVDEVDLVSGTEIPGVPGSRDC